MLIGSIRNQTKKKTHQHWLLVGPRGIGKSHIITFIYNTVKEDNELRKNWLPVIFPEQGYGIISLYDFMEKIIELARKESEEDWQEILKILRKEGNEREAVEKARSFLIDYTQRKGKKILLLVENLNRLLGKRVLSDPQKNGFNEKWLRSFLMNDNAILLIGTSPIVFKQLIDHKSALYNFFRIEYLEEISPEECEEIWLKRAKYEKRDDFINLMKVNKGSLEALYNLAGGNPRIVLMLYEIALNYKNLGRVESQFFSLLEELTPYFQACTENLSPQQEKILIGIAQSETAITPSDIARKLRIKVNIVTAQLNELEKKGFIRFITKEKSIRKEKGIKKEKGRKLSYYDLRESIYRYWYLAGTELGKAPVRMFIKFIALWYSEPELMRYQETYRSIAESRPEYRRLFEYSQRALLLKRSLRKEILRQNIIDAYNQLMINKVIKLSPAYLKKKSKDIDILRIYGVALSEKGSFRKAIDNFRIITEIKPDDVDAFNNWGIALANLAELKQDETLFRESFDKYRKVTEIKPDDTIAFNNWGIALANLAELKQDETLFRESFDKYRKATEIKPDDTIAFNNWGIALANLAKLKQDETLFRESFDKYRKAVDLKPDDVNTFNNWGIALANLAELKQDETLFRESFDKYRKAIEIKANDPAVFYNWGNSLAKLAKLKKSTSLYKKALDKFIDSWKIIKEKKVIDHPLMVNTLFRAALIALGLNRNVTYKKLIYELLENLSKIVISKRTLVYFYLFIINLLKLRKVDEVDKFITEILKPSYKEKFAFLQHFDYLIKYYLGDKTIIERVPKELQKVLKEMIKEIEGSDNT